MNTKSLITKAAVALVAVWVLWVGYKWTVMRVYVPQDKALLVLNKFGDPLPSDLVVVPKGENRYKGVQEEVLGPGRYFINPIEYHTELVDLLEIPAGDPQLWEWDSAGRLKNSETAPKVGLVTMKQGKSAAASEEVVTTGYRGIQAEVLTPGTYKINPQLEAVQLVPATIVPPGSVGVVTRLVGDMGGISVSSAPLSRVSTTNPSTQPAGDEEGRLVVGPTHRGILRNVLQPGIYYLNPRVVRVTIVPVGYDEVALEKAKNSAVRFYSQDGYEVEADFTVVWGRTPTDAPEIVANIGDTQRIEQNVIQPAMKAACQNEGSKYTAVELIQGLTRSKFQDDLSAALEKQVSPRHISVLLALVRSISIKDRTGVDATQGLLATMQRANIEVERNLTNEQKTETAAKAADLEQAMKLIDVAKETVTGETTVMVANINANAAKTAAETDAERDLSVATISLEVARLDAQRTEILGKAQADVERMKNDAEAKGSKLLVEALGSPQAYNQYIFAKNFEPTELRLIFAGPGTFWTDLKSFQDIGAAKVIQAKPADSGK
ncbi:MAG TPA: SPFH domain-containing protein [Tepidisphaeraceae bacterium]|jgi:regulator of protease activity HflC (stomatin/prohibitin superfamily)|nr:SPFH domain-containing protein [Tepidisphaeraceae bacterium]